MRLLKATEIGSNAREGFIPGCCWGVWGGWFVLMLAEVKAKSNL